MAYKTITKVCAQTPHKGLCRNLKTVAAELIQPLCPKGRSEQSVSGNWQKEVLQKWSLWDLQWPSVEGHSRLSLGLYSGDRARGTNPLTSFSSFPPSDLSGAPHCPGPIRSHKGWGSYKPDPLGSPEKGREWTWRGKQKMAMHRRLGSSKQEAMRIQICIQKSYIYL